MAKRLGWYLPEQLVLKITLLGSEPKIWRRVEVHSGLTLHELHVVIQCVFDWSDSHLYHFLAPPGGKLTRRAMADAERYHVLPPDPVFAEDQDDRPADESLVGQVINREQKQVVYEYDFGDSWEHLVKVEKRTPGGEQDHVPVCLAGENAAPLDDMGGIYGYYEYLAALHDEGHEMHDDAVDLLGEDFDPTRFDLAEANKRLKATFRPAPKRPPRKSGKKRK
jgi:hypothetical protein